MSKRKRPVLAHPHRDCAHVCAAEGCLSDITSSKTYHVFKLEEERKNFCKLTASIEDDSCLCPKCYNRLNNLWKGKTREAEAKADEEAPSTSWNQPTKARRKERSPCYLTSFGLCNEVSAHYTACSDWAVFVAHMRLHQFDTEPQAEVSLCLTHYKSWNAAERVTHCSVCKRLFSKTVKPLNIPNCDEILAYFKEIGDAKANLPRDSKICIKCYKEFAKLKEHMNRVSFSDETSLDAEVQGMLTLYSGYLTQPANPENIPFHHAVVFCLKKLLAHTPFLLSEAYTVYRRAMDDYTKLSSVSTPSYYSSSTLLGKLMQSLNKHMRQSTLQQEPSLGTLLWRAGDSTADLLLRQLNATKKIVSSRQTTEPESTHSQATDVDYLVQAATILKGDIHQVSDKFREQTHKQDFASFDVSEIIQVLPSRLWNFFAMVTETKSQQAQREVSVDPGWLHAKHYVPEGVGDVGHRHKLRTLFGVCHAVYTHDDRCGYPIHTLLGEAVHGLGGSDELMRILNRFGITSSLSKIRDYEMDHVYIRLKYGWENIFTDDAFCFASVDNVDKSSAHASVKAAGGARGIHATSYQIVEPRPRGLITSTEKTDLPSTSSGIQPSRTQMVLPTSVSVNMINELRRKTRPQVISWNRSRKNVPYGSLKDFETQPKEYEAIHHATTALLGYAIAKNSASATSDTESRLLFPDLNLICPVPHSSAVEKSNVFYVGVLNEHADNINTIKEVVETLHEEIVLQRNLESLAVVGDGKTFFHLAKLKQEYSSELEWMIPFPGDWHTLKNLQPVLMKVYWHAGLSDLASTVHKGATLASVFQCSNFRRSHDFLILAWEALLRTQISSFMKYVDEHPELGLEERLMVKVVKKLAAIRTLDSENAPQAMLDTWELVGGREFGQVFSDFRQKMSTDETYKLWDSFIHRDALAYIMLFVAIRTGNWHLRIGALKKMAPLFHAFDRPTYLRLVPRHLLDVLQMPKTMLDHLQNGGFVASLKGIPGRSVAADECHEMKINKEVKMAMAKPVPDMMDRMALLLPYRATAIERLKSQVIVGELKGAEKSNASELVNMEAKVQIYMAKLAETPLSSYRPQHDASPLHTFSGQFADAAQREDMMQFYEVGEQSLKSYISTRLLNVPSVDVPHRQRRLKTFLPKRKRQTKVSLKAKNTKIVTRCLRKIIVQSKNMHQPVEHLGQFIELPLAIANPKGTMVHGNKANSTGVYRRRYSEAFTKTLPAGWKPESVILEGMFMINSSPMRSAQVFRDYTYHLVGSFILPRFALGAHEVHVVFDHPGRNGTSPKDLERLRRAEGMQETQKTVQFHGIISADTPLPDRSTHSWREAMLSDRDTKRKLVNFLATDLLIVAQEFLKEGQQLVSAGGFDGDMIDKAKIATKFSIKEGSHFSSNHEESDSRVWLHCLNSPYSRVLIYSPDTDTYHIGLRTLYSHAGMMKKDAVVQLSMSIDSNEYVSLTKFVNLLTNDPDLGALPKDQLPTIMQTIFIASGCDYTSFFYGCGKASFLATFFQHANFITGSDEEGTLADNDIQSGRGLLAFYRLIGSLYYKKFSSVMPSDFKTPKQLFQSFKTEDANLKIHQNWLNSIREHSWEKVDSEEEVMPSNEALSLHWQRTCWVAHLWGQAGSHQVNHAPITEYGYCHKNNALCIEWDTPNNIKKVEDLVKDLTKGCKCKSGCGTRRCSCNKDHKNCRPGCSCCNCVNPHNDGKCTLCSEGEEIPNTRDLVDLSVSENSAMPSLQPDDTVYESEDGEDDLFSDSARLTDDTSTDESEDDSEYQTFGPLEDEGEST